VPGLAVFYRVSGFVVCWAMFSSLEVKVLRST
jgi:hypothetical protein